MTREPTYDELAAERRREWERAQRVAADQNDAERARISQMPDVVNRPNPAIPWSFQGLVCPTPDCGGTAFYVPKWVTINGVKYRAEVVCTMCKKYAVWDWNERKWISDAS